ncbi:Putative pyrophosphatase [Hathewaya histolytica]|uniref:Putative pyrophosphatase n=2 Tax=Hathewaya histolytica TaxID=1498 RepID=A0A4U9RVJ1_HATHI|nr:putative pyrophosphatase [Hathewaya histolytica]
MQIFIIVNLKGIIKLFKNYRETWLHKLCFSLLVLYIKMNLGILIRIGVLQMSIEKLTEAIQQFNQERDWDKFHNLKDLAISISLESSELLECFQWKEVDYKSLNEEDKLKLKEEIADVAIYLLMFCNKANINLEEAIEEKIKKNSIKYPVDKFKGSSKKYNEI